MSKRKVTIILGPTASGKTKTSIAVAGYLNMEIISADSRQIYKGIRIASAIPSEEERKGIVHHFMEELEPEEEYNAGKYGTEARKRIEDIFEKSKLPLVVGGSGLYLQSLTEGLFEEKSKSNEIRNKLKVLLNEKGKEYLYNELKKIDPESAEKMSPGYTRRIIRAMEVFYVTGKKISQLQKNLPQIEFEFLKVGLQLEKEELYKRIIRRVDEMLEAGLLNEILALKKRGLHYSVVNSLNTVGVKEIFDYLDGKCSLAEAIELIKRNTRRYAKRQMTWFRKDETIKWITLKPEKDLSKEIIKIIESKILH